MRRLLLSYLTLTLVVLLFLEIPLGLVYAREQRRRLTASVERDALALSIRAEEGLEADGAAALRTLARNTESDTGGRVVVIRTDGSVVADSEAGTGPSENFREPARVPGRGPTQESIGSRHSKTLGHDILFFAVPIVNANELVGALRVTYPTSYVDTRIARLVGPDRDRRHRAAHRVPGEPATRPPGHDPDRATGQSVRPLRGRGARRAEPRSRPVRPSCAALTEQFNTTAARVEGLVHSQREFVADASHQLRTPLAALRLRLENLESDLGADDVARADVAGSLAEVGRLSRLVDGLLELARAERVSDTPSPARCRGRRRGRVEAWTAYADEHGVSYETDIGPSLAGRATPGRLEQVLDNLIANAIDVSPAGGTIRIDRRPTATTWSGSRRR